MKALRNAYGLRIFLKTKIGTSISTSGSRNYQRTSTCLAQTKEPTDAPVVPFRTSINDPRQHNLDHAGLFYSISNEVMQSQLKDCVNSILRKTMDTFSENCLMIREPSLEVNTYLQNFNYRHPIPRFILYGRDGAGKSSCLAHTIHWCAANDWIIVHSPFTEDYMLDRKYEKKEVTESSFKPKRFDVPNEGISWLQHFSAQNEGKLGSIKTSQDYIWTKREKSDAGSTLEEIVNYGLSRPKFSCDCVGVILKELRQQAGPLGLKVLVAIEAVNALFVFVVSDLSLPRPDKVPMSLHENSLVHNFKKMLIPNWTGGAAVCTADVKVNNHDLREDYKPKYVLGTEGFEVLDPFVPIFVPEYSNKEAISHLNYYRDRRWLQNKLALTEEAFKELMFVSNNNGMSLHKLTVHL